MCLLSYLPPASSLSRRDCINASRSNPDGAGIAYSDGERVHIIKSPKWSGERVYDELERLRDFPRIAHWRYATHGSVVAENAHPFAVAGVYGAAHNGVISTINLPVNDAIRRDESDTRFFLRTVAAPLIQELGTINKLATDYMGELVGSHNKLAFITPAGEVHLVNESSGHWIAGEAGRVWVSNTHSLDSYWSGGSVKAYSRPAIIASHYTPDCSFCGGTLYAVNVTDDGDILCDACAEDCD